MHKIRQMQTQDYNLLEKFLYNAIYIPVGEEMPPFEIIHEPEIFVYIKDFGGMYDFGVVAELDNDLVGAAWTRIIPAYGNIDKHTPELAISVDPKWRGQGIGTDLMNHLFDSLRSKGYKRTSLSVQRNNPRRPFLPASGL
ncbi:MAG: GNAT family N-acetyltransferase [Defluviitaleaceae bacterium]|nr:GNAT family N-acetyltransferase [Defluviitaleaceae bacterium]